MATLYRVQYGAMRWSPPLAVTTTLPVKLSPSGVKAEASKSPPLRVVRLLKRERSRCLLCGLRFTTEDVVEVHHWDGNRHNNRYANLVLLHGHYHDEIHGKRY
jgi:hypothetical protein